MRYLAALIVVGCASVPPSPLRGVDNFAQMNAGLYRGAQPTVEGFRELKALGVKTVINLRLRHSSRKEVEAAGMSSVEIRMQADIHGVPPTDDQLKQFFAVVLEPARRPVFFHCAHGRDRTGTMAAVYRIEIDGWSNEQAIEEMQARGFNDIYQGLLDYVRRYRPRGFKR